MKNILSYTMPYKLTGQELIDWIKYQIEHDTSKRKYAERLNRRFIIKPNHIYSLNRTDKRDRQWYGRRWDYLYYITKVKQETA